MSHEWLRSARFVWFITGNLEKNQAIAIAEKTRALFKVHPVPKTFLMDVRPVNLPEKSSLLFEFPINNQNDPNSVYLTYF